MNEEQISHIEIGKIHPSKTNPRKNFDAEKLKDLADSIRTQGIIQPLLVRPAWCMGKTAEQIQLINGDAPAVDFLELVAGERRHRAANMAQLSRVPVIIRFLGDQETLELQLIENLQRDDLDPFEEAAGYQQLLNLRDGHGKPIHTVDTIHRRVSKPRRRVWYRLKLLAVPDAVRVSVLGGGLSVQAAELIGSIPTKELRAAAAEEILHPAMREGPLPVNGPGGVREVISLRYMRSLVGAPFDPTDKELVAVMEDDQTGERIGGGACGDCPMRTGNMEAIIGKTKRPDVCTNPQCFLKKSDVYFERLMETAVKDGKRVLTSKEAADVFDEDGSIYLDCDYVVISGKPDPQEVRQDFTGRMPRWQALLEGLESKPQILIARDPKGRVVELVDRALAIEAVNLAAKQKGEKSIFDRTAARPLSSNRASSAATAGNGDAEPEWKRQDRKNREIAKLNFQITLAGMTELIAAIDKGGPVKGFWDALIEASITHAGHDGCWLICKRLGLDPKAENGHTNIEGVQGAALEYGLTLPDDKLKLGYLVELLLSQRVKIYNSGSLGGIRGVEEFKRFAKLYRIDLGAVERSVKAANKETKKPKEKKPEVKSANVPGAGKTVFAKAAVIVPHKFEHIADNKYRCTGCGAPAVKHKGEILVAKDFRGKSCAQTEGARTKRTIARTVKKPKSKSKPNKAKKATKKGGAK